MLLSRVADALYWISRYVERAEHTARLIDVAVDLRLGRLATVDSTAFEICGSLVLPASVAPTPSALLDVALFDVTNANSVAACIVAARDNARQVRDEISSEMWEQINALFLQVRQMRENVAYAGRINYASQSIINGVHLFSGTTDATMSHGEGWQYLQVGKYLERAVATAALLDAFLGDEDGRAAMRPLDQADWVALLRSSSALEAYCRQYTADVRAERVTEFLLLNAEFPRSIRFAATRIEAALLGIGTYGGRTASARAQRLSGRLRASLDYSQVDEVINEGSHAYLAGLGRQCAQIHAALYQGYIAYPIESALPA